jgi:hypothetical protein
VCLFHVSRCGGARVRYRSDMSFKTLRSIPARQNFTGRASRRYSNTTEVCKPASAMGFPSQKALQNAIRIFCKG